MSASTDPDTYRPRGLARIQLPARPPARHLVHLVHLVHMGWQPGFDPTSSWVDWALVAGVVAVFVPLYLASCTPSARQANDVLRATVVLGALATPLNVGASVLFVYAAVMAGQLYGRRALRWHLGLSGLLLVLGLLSPVPFPYRIYGVLPSFAFIWISGQQAVEEGERRRDADRLRIDAARAEQLATGAERERIARDLHDLLGQSLTGLVVHAQLVQSLVHREPDAAARAAGELERTAREVLDQVRSAVGGLREISLADEIDAARRTLAAAGLAVAVDIPDDAAPNPLIERSLALALREAVTNVVRHAQARDCRIVLSRHQDVWRLEISDDGVGARASEGNGLRGMRERIAAIGGAVERTAAGGTTVVVTVPA